MEKHRTGSLLVTAVILASVLLTGCSARIEKPRLSNGYSTLYAPSAVEYSITLTKEISAICNVLTTRAAVAEEISRGEYSLSSEITNTETALTTLNDIQNTLITTMPAQDYEDDRQNLIDMLADTIEHVKEYKSALEDGDAEKAGGYAETLMGDYSAISGISLPVYQ